MQPPCRRRFQREVEAAAKINHPNVVAALDADEARGVHFLVMEYVDGQDLSAAWSNKTDRCPLKKLWIMSCRPHEDLRRALKKGLSIATSSPPIFCWIEEGTVKILDMGLGAIPRRRTVRRVDIHRDDHGICGLHVS